MRFSFFGLLFLLVSIWGFFKALLWEGVINPIITGSCHVDDMVDFSQWPCGDDPHMALLYWDATFLFISYLFLSWALKMFGAFDK